MKYINDFNTFGEYFDNLIEEAEEAGVEDSESFGIIPIVSDYNTAVTIVNGLKDFVKTQNSDGQVIICAFAEMLMESAFKEHLNQKKAISLGGKPPKLSVVH